MTVLARENDCRLRNPRDDRAARATLRNHGRSFHFASQLMGRRHASRAARLYSFCRHVDDLADNARVPADAAAQLAEVRRGIAEYSPRNAISADFLELAEETDMPLAPALALIDGACDDLAGVTIADESDLLRYAHSVAGTVGAMMCHVLDVSDPAAVPHAVDLGIAMQLTNIARDVGEDARAGRRYLPASWVDGADAALIQDPDEALRPLLRSAIARSIQLAESYYASGEAGLSYIPPRARPAIRVAARVYRAIGGRVAANDYCSWRERAIVGHGRKLVLAAGALAAPRTGSRRRPMHDPALHQCLAGCYGVDKRAQR